ncbi:putative fungal zn binuclear cluster domain-containing protein [Rosellinia necatrix]|uniref:Putative fungal zn binuclear cluster domain-containing protein n=1 Tax=Rosellinia necatrix TaxID=77044 RepID=A0A1W2TET6_ROSNE|nr:putative fungal zn binuclear cluster domain-containing protein [Rosellinia necatrix]
MASVASASPSGHGFLRANSTDDTDSWQYIDNSPPVGYTPSPGSSLNGWGITGYSNHLGASPTAMSPLPPPTSQSSQHDTANTTAEDTGNHFLPLSDSQQFMVNHDLFYSDLLGSTMNAVSFESGLQEGGICHMPSFEGMGIQSQSMDLNIPMQFQDGTNVAPWAPMRIYDDDFLYLVPENDSAQMSRTSSYGSVGVKSHHSSPRAPSTKAKHTKDTDPIKKVRGNGRVDKKKATSRDNFVVVTPNTIHQQFGKANPFECFEAARGVQRGRKGPLAGKAAESALNIRRMGACFCCHSRKVKCDEERPCKNCKKISAQVPQVVCWQFSDFLPVLFPDFIRGHFKREVITRFISDNVAEFYRPPSAPASEPCLIEMSSGARFRSTLTIPASFFAPRSTEVLQHWHMGIAAVGGGRGAAHQLDLHLRRAVAVGVDPKDGSQREALKRRVREYAHGLASEPQYAEQVTDALRGTQLPRRVLGIVQRFAQRADCAMAKRALGIYATHYVLTRQLVLTPATLARLDDVQRMPDHDGSTVGTHHHHHSPAVTARVLNRQVKAVLDEHLMRETQKLFGDFGSALKPRSRAEWAPCLAAFLVLCLLFEAVEAAADVFVVSEAEIALRTRRRSTFAAAPLDENMVGGGGGFAVGARSLALDVCRAIDNLPFRQVAYRFHTIYQTHHVRESGGGGGGGGSATGPPGGCGNGNGNGNGPAFNPLVDPKWDADLEPAAAEMAASLRALIDGDDSWHELDFLAADPILIQSEAHPYPRDITLDYTGRLLSRFLLSFMDEKYLFDGQY